MRTRGDRNAYFEAGVAGELHVRFPFRIAGEVRLAVARVACRGGPALRLVAGPKRADHLDEVAARIVEDGATRGDALALQDVRA